MLLLEGSLHLASTLLIKENSDEIERADMAIQVTYRRTRRLSMRIVKNGDVHVSAPFGMPKAEVERFIEEHRDWIADARKRSSENQKRRIAFYNQLPLTKHCDD